MSFSGDVSKWVAKVKVETDTQLKAVAFELFSRVIQRSPVDTGRFRGNWQISFGNEPQATPTDTLDPSGNATQAAVLGDLGNVRAGQVIWIANALPYATRLEYGWSKQAPSGMVRLTAAEFTDIVRSV